MKRRNILILIIVVLAIAAIKIGLKFKPVKALRENVNVTDVNIANPAPAKQKNNIQNANTDPTPGIDCACKDRPVENDKTLDQLFDEANQLWKSYSGNTAVLEESVDLYCRAICKDPKFGPAYAGMSRLLAKESADRGGPNGYNEEIAQLARLWLDRAKELSPDDHRYLIAEWTYGITVAQTTGDRRRAKEYIQRAIDADPNVADYYRIRAQPWNRKSWEDGVADLNKALELATNDVELSMIWGLYAETYQEKGLYREWENAFLKEIQKAPNNAWKLNNLGSGYNKIGRCKEGKKTLEKALKIMNFGMARKNLQEAEECIALHKKYGEPPPEFFEAMFVTSAFAWAKKNNREDTVDLETKAFELMGKAASKKPFNPYIQIMYVILFSDIQKKDDPKEPFVAFAEDKLNLIEKKTGEGCETKFLREYIEIRKKSSPRSIYIEVGSDKKLFDECDLSYIKRYADYLVIPDI